MYVCPCPSSAACLNARRYYYLFSTCCDGRSAPVALHPLLLLHLSPLAPGAWVQCRRHASSGPTWPHLVWVGGCELLRATSGHSHVGPPCRCTRLWGLHATHPYTVVACAPPTEHALCLISSATLGGPLHGRRTLRACNVIAHQQVLRHMELATRPLFRNRTAHVEVLAYFCMHTHACCNSTRLTVFPIKSVFYAGV